MNYHSLFKDILYFDEAHAYIHVPTGKKLPSVTGLIKKYSKPFDEKFWLPKKAKQLGVSEYELKKEWDLKGKIGRETGTIIHNYLENRFRGKIFPFNIPDYISKERVAKLIEVCERYYNECEYDVAALELVVGNEFYAGTLDKLLEGGIIRDYKQGSLKDGYDMMKYPYENMIDSSLNKYAVQLNHYRHALEEKGITINKMEIVFFEEDGYSIHDIPFLPVIIEDQVL